MNKTNKIELHRELKPSKEYLEKRKREEEEYERDRFRQSAPPKRNLFDQ